MRTYFGKFLVKKGIINEEDLIQTLIEQVSLLPPTIRVAYDVKAFTVMELFEIFQYQVEKKLEFKAACIALNKWSQKIETAILAELHKKRIPLGELLVKNKKITVTQLTDNLEEYLKEKKGEVPASKLFTVRDSMVGQKRSPLSVVPTFTRVDENIVVDYLELLNDEKKTEMEKVILSLEQSKEEKTLEEGLRLLYRDLHTLKGSARFMKAELTEKVIHESEEILSFAQRFVTQLSAEDYSKVTSMNLKVLDVVWDLRDALKKNGSEEVFWIDRKQRETYEDICGELVSFKSELDSRNLSIDLDKIEEAF